MRRLLIAFFLFGIVIPSAAQLYSYSPAADYSAVLNMDEYSVHQIDIYPVGLTDFYMMEWRLVGNTCPESWDFQLCDWATCFDGMPNTAVMDTIFPGGHGLLKVTVNPFTEAGSGTLTFWIFPEGDMASHETVTFHFETIVASVSTHGNSASTALQLFPQPARDHLNYSGMNTGTWQLYDLSGRIISSFYLERNDGRLDISSLQRGVYFLRQGSRTVRFTCID
jgi:hypothetical protein